MCFFFFNDTATTEIYTLSLHDALPISTQPKQSYRFSLELCDRSSAITRLGSAKANCAFTNEAPCRSEEHTSELQSRLHLVCRLLLEKKKDIINQRNHLRARRDQLSNSG